MGGVSVAVGTNYGNWEALLDPRRKWYNDWGIICLNFWIFLLLVTSATSGYDGSMMNGLQSLTQWKKDFNYPSDSKLGLLNAIQNIGCLGAYPFAPYLSDGIGRRRTIILGALIMCAGAVLQSLTTSVKMFISARFMVGFGLALAANAAPILISEIAYPPHRATLTAMYNSLWYGGSILAAWATFGSFRIQSSWAWRLPSLLQGSTSFLQLCLIWLAPESPRWLIAKGREGEALNILAHYHAGGKELDPLVQYEFEEIKAAIEFDREAAANMGWGSFVRKKGNLKRLSIIIAIAFFSQWSGNGLVSYYLAKVLDTIGITDPAVQLRLNGILQVWNLCIALTASILVERIGRRVLFISSCAGMLLFFTLQTICTAVFAETGREGAANTVIVLIFLFYAAYDIAFTPLIVSYAVEILPYSMRAKGLTILSFAVSLSIIFNQYVNPIALSKLGWKYYIIYCFWIALELVYCIFFIVETKNLTLEETAILFDGKDVLRNFSRNAEIAAAGGHVSQISVATELSDFTYVARTDEGYSKATSRLPKDENALGVYEY